MLEANLSLAQRHSSYQSRAELAAFAAKDEYEMGRRAQFEAENSAEKAEESADRAWPRGSFFRRSSRSYRGHTVTKKDLLQESLVLLKTSAAELRQQAASTNLSALQKAARALGPQSLRRASKGR